MEVNGRTHATEQRGRACGLHARVHWPAEDGAILGGNVAAEEIIERKRAKTALQLANEIPGGARTLGTHQVLWKNCQGSHYGIVSFRPRSSHHLAN